MKVPGRTGSFVVPTCSGNSLREVLYRADGDATSIDHMRDEMVHIDTGTEDRYSVSGRPNESANEETRQSIRILVIDGDVTLRQTVKSYLEENNMQVTSVTGREELMRRVSEIEPSLIILDSRPGDEEELDLLRNIRSQSDVPIIIATSRRHDEADRVAAFELGADDYLVKPFGLRELLARIRAVLRRGECTHTDPRQEQRRKRCRFNGWELNRSTRCLTDSHGEPVSLSKGEYALLLAFLDSPQRPLSREHLLQATRKHEDIFDRSVDVQIMRLRRKLEIEPSLPSVIRTEHGIGYIFDLPVIWL